MVENGYAGRRVSNRPTARRTTAFGMIGEPFERPQLECVAAASPILNEGPCTRSIPQSGQAVLHHKPAMPPRARLSERRSAYAISFPKADGRLPPDFLIAL